MELYALENEAADSTVIEDLSDDEGYASSVLSDDSQEDLIPETLAPPLDEAPEEMRDRVKKERLERRKYRHRRRREKAQRELRKRRAQHEAEQAAVLEAFRKDALIAHAKAELEWMELEEEARVIEKQAFRARANLRKVALYCQGKGMDELRARYDPGVHLTMPGVVSFWSLSQFIRVGAVAACQRDHRRDPTRVCVVLRTPSTRRSAQVQGPLLPQGVHREDSVKGQRHEMAGNLYGRRKEKKENQGPSGQRHALHGHAIHRGRLPALLHAPIAPTTP